MLETGQTAPEFNAKNQDNQVVSLSGLLEKNTVVLYFYPKDDTPGCTIEANQFTDLVDEFARKNAVVIGISKDNCQSHKNFITKYGLKLDLIADESGSICQSYGVWQEKEKNGVKKMGIVRSTFIVGKNGKLNDVMYKVTADGHAKDILNKIST